MRTNEYTVRSEGGGITGGPWRLLQDATDGARTLAIENEGQTIGLYRNGRPVKIYGAHRTWTCGPKAEVQR